MITLAAAASISKAKIETLEKTFGERVTAWYELCCQHGILPYIYEGYRSPERQDELYAQGRTKPGKIITNARAWQSSHQYSRAFDWVPLERVAKAADMYEANWEDETTYALGAKLGLDFKFRALSWETPHLEDANFKDWRELWLRFRVEPLQG